MGLSFRSLFRTLSLNPKTLKIRQKISLKNPMKKSDNLDRNHRLNYNRKLHLRVEAIPGTLIGQAPNLRIRLHVFFLALLSILSHETPLRYDRNCSRTNETSANLQHYNRAIPAIGVLRHISQPVGPRDSHGGCIRV